METQKGGTVPKDNSNPQPVEIKPAKAEKKPFINKMVDRFERIITS